MNNRNICFDLICANSQSVCDGSLLRSGRRQASPTARLEAIVALSELANECVGSRENFVVSPQLASGLNVSASEARRQLISKSFALCCMFDKLSIFLFNC